MPTYRPSLCFFCRHFVLSPNGSRCAAYPEQIPSRFLTALEYHTELEGDEAEEVFFEKSPSLLPVQESMLEIVLDTAREEA